MRIMIFRGKPEEKHLRIQSGEKVTSNHNWILSLMIYNPRFSGLDGNLQVFVLGEVTSPC